MSPCLGFSIAAWERDHLIGLGQQHGIVAADQDQALLGPLMDHGPYAFSCSGIEEGGGFIQHLHRFVAQPGPKKSQAMNLSALEGVLRQRHGGIQAAIALQEVV